jgi:hypothetical protein
VRYRKKPVIIDAFQFTGGPDQKEDPEWIVEAIKNKTVGVYSMNENGICKLEIQTLEGTMAANVGDYVIKGIEGEIYPCKPDIFEKTYEPVK